MNGILGTIQLVLDTKLTMEQLDYILTMKHSADSLLSIINDILLFSKLEANQFKLHSTVFRIEHLLEGVGGLLSSLVNDKQLNLFFLLEPNMPQHMIGDVDRLQQILVNMIGNAVKFTNPSGEVLVACTNTCSTCYIRSVFGADENSPFSSGGGMQLLLNKSNRINSFFSCAGPHTCTKDITPSGTTRLYFEVRDSGCGMSEKQMELLFTPFYQADSISIPLFSYFCAIFPLRYFVFLIRHLIFYYRFNYKGSGWNRTRTFDLQATSGAVQRHH